jgi:hypothetical protein
VSELENLQFLFKCKGTPYFIDPNGYIVQQQECAETKSCCSASSCGEGVDDFSQVLAVPVSKSKYLAIVGGKSVFSKCFKAFCKGTHNSLPGSYFSSSHPSAYGIGVVHTLNGVVSGFSPLYCFTKINLRSAGWVEEDGAVSIKFKRVSTLTEETVLVRVSRDGLGIKIFASEVDLVDIILPINFLTVAYRVQYKPWSDVCLVDSHRDGFSDVFDCLFELLGVSNSQVAVIDDVEGTRHKNSVVPDSEDVGLICENTNGEYKLGYVRDMWATYMGITGGHLKALHPVEYNFNVRNFKVAGTILFDSFVSGLSSIDEEADAYSVDVPNLNWCKVNNDFIVEENLYVLDMRNVAYIKLYKQSIEVCKNPFEVFSSGLYSYLSRYGGLVAIYIPSVIFNTEVLISETARIYVVKGTWGKGKYASPFLTFVPDRVALLGEPLKNFSLGTDSEVKALIDYIESNGYKVMNAGAFVAFKERDVINLYINGVHIGTSEESDKGTPLYLIKSVFDKYGVSGLKFACSYNYKMYGVAASKDCSTYQCPEGWVPPCMEWGIKDILQDWMTVEFL